MANDLFVHHAVSGGDQRSGPFKSINEAIQKACALLRTHGPTAIVSIHDNGHVIMGGNEVRKRCEAALTYGLIAVDLCRVWLVDRSGANILSTQVNRVADLVF